MVIKAPVKIDKITKRLVNKIERGDIAIIFHKDIDEIAANSLIDKKVSAVINCKSSISGRYPNLGPSILHKSKIRIFDLKDGNLLDTVIDNDIITLDKNNIFLNNKVIGTVKELTGNDICKKMKIAEQNIELELEKFIDNTLKYAHKEKEIILGDLQIPNIKTPIRNKQVLVVVRGNNYREDLSAILTYIKDINPVLIGVDGGGDALLEFGLVPDIIIGDMDSVSDNCLMLCNEIIVHGYLNGDAPGLKRIEALDLTASVFAAPGTSEDIAMLLAYDKGADLIVAVGTHTNMIDFLEKGRKGMSSTFLVRLKVGYKLLDAKGVSKLYKNNFKSHYFLYIFIAGLIPILIILLTSQSLINLLRLLFIRFKMISSL